MELIFVNDSMVDVDSQLFTTILRRLPDVIPNIRQEEVELLLTNNETIRELNLEYREKDKPTDVLSFPFEDEQQLGQIVISVERADEQAEEIGQSLEEELQFLFTHGLLHLLGYDHETRSEEAQMLEKAYALLQRKHA